MTHCDCGNIARSWFNCQTDGHGTTYYCSRCLIFDDVGTDDYEDTIPPGEINIWNGDKAFCSQCKKGIERRSNKIIEDSVIKKSDIEITYSPERQVNEYRMEEFIKSILGDIIPKNYDLRDKRQRLRYYKLAYKMNSNEILEAVQRDPRINADIREILNTFKKY